MLLFDASVPRRGLVSRPLAIMLFSLGVLAALVWSLFSSRSDRNRTNPGAPLTSAPPAAAAGSQPDSGTSAGELVVYCAASNKSVFEAIRQEYEAAYPTRLLVQYGPSQTLLASLRVAGTGDLYLPADDSYLGLAKKEQLLVDQFPLARMQAVVAVPKGNPKKITRLADLLQDGVRLALASEEASAIGKMTREHLLASGQWEPLKARASVFKTTVNEVANDVKVGAVDAGIVFDAVLHDYPTLEAVSLPELQPVVANISVGVLKSSRQSRQAAHFARFMASRDKGLTHYRRFGFQPVEGDEWTEQPEITLYAGSMLRPAIEETITAFEEREGVRVTRVYNGCGILVAQMKAGQVPDAYFACDSEFMTQVKALFPSPLNISQNELVILVKKGNPLGIRSLKDLTQPNLRVGIGHEKQCAMGWITQRTFDESGLKTEVMKNVVVQTPTGDMLVNQMRSGSLDAAVAYLSNAAGSAEFLDAIRIQGLQCAVATQPIAIAKDSRHKQLVARLLQAIQDEESKDRFTVEGFRWVGQR